MENGLLKDFFDESLLIATKGEDDISQIIVEEIAESIEAKYLIKGIRQWGRTASENSWTDSLMDFSTYHLLNKGNLTEFEMKAGHETFGTWKIIKTYGNTV